MVESGVSEWASQRRDRERKKGRKKRVHRAQNDDGDGGGGEEADVINGNCAKVPRRTRVTPVPH